jgi:hypothetical protein
MMLQHFCAPLFSSQRGLPSHGLTMDTRKPEKSAQAAGTPDDPVQTGELSLSLDAGPELDIAEVGSLIHEIGVTPAIEFEKLIGELEEARTYLQSEGERIQSDAVRYVQLSQTASLSVKVISETVADWRKAGHPERSTNGGTTLPAQWLLLTASSDCET